jgi:uncharacterized OB-fold protein
VGARIIEADAPRILPQLNDANRPFWTGGSSGTLLISYCAACDRWVHPPAERCAMCREPMRPMPVRGTGTLFTFTVNQHQYNPEVPPPYVIAVVELDEQSDLRLPTNIVHCELDSLRCGLPVRVLFERHGSVFVPLFEPLVEHTE